MRDRLQGALGERYLIGRELGRGGMATVWLAEDRHLGRPVALKVLHAELAGAIGVDRFVREVRVTAKLQHPGVVPVLDAGVLTAVDGTSLPWFAMAYVEGETLRARLKREVQLPVDEAIRITRDVAEALEAAHAQGIVHRDIKPENVMLAGARTYVVDFGVAKALVETGEERLTSTGIAVGTPAYMSPEQIGAGVVDARSDQYGLAMLLYEMLAGEPPVTGRNAQSIFARRLSEPAPPVHTLRPTVPTGVEQVLLRALERVPADRYPDVASFIAALDASWRGAALNARMRPSRIAMLGVLGLLLLVPVLWFALGPPRASARPRDPALLALFDRGRRGFETRQSAGLVDAVDAFNAAIRADSAFQPAWVWLSRSYTRAYWREFTIPGVPRESLLHRAVRAKDRAFALDSTDSYAWLALAEVSRFVDPTDPEPPIRAARRAIALDSTNATAWHNLAVGTFDRGDYARGLGLWREAVRRDPGYDEGVAFMALAHLWGGRYDSALVWADSAVVLNPTFLLAHQARGNVEVERGAFDRSINSFRAALAVSTGIEIANSWAGVALAQGRAGRRDSARVAAMNAARIADRYDPVPHHTAIYIAEAYAAMGDTARAIGWLKRWPARASLHYQMHLRCDPAMAPLVAVPAFRAIVTGPSTPGGCR